VIPPRDVRTRHGRGDHPDGDLGIRGPQAGVVVISRVAQGVHWHALDDDVVVGRGHALRRPDGRVFISVDSWRDDAFEVLAVSMMGDLGSPVYTVVDDDDREVTERWRSLGFVDHRSEVELLVPTAAEVTGLTGSHLPSGACILPAGSADRDRLRHLDRVLRQEIDATIGWQHMPAEVARPADEQARFDPSRYVVAVQDGEYVGLARIAPLPRRPRLGLVAVRAAYRGRGLARAMLAEAFRPLHESGIMGVCADVDRLNERAMALFAALGAQFAGGALELVH
jgi:RimJ/RimL family protein N-acetyltransferase